MSQEVKKGEVKSSSQTAGGSTVLCCECIWKYSPTRESLFFLVVPSLRATGHEAVTRHHEHTCNMHQMGLLKSLTWALVFGEHPIQWLSHLSSLPCTTHLTAPGLSLFVHMDAQLSWKSLHTKPGASYCCLHQKLKENKSCDGKNTMPWWGAGPQHPVCVLWEPGDCISWEGKTGWENDFS